MFTNNLFDQILIDPIQGDINKLQIVSGYATAAMAFKHLSALDDRRIAGIEISLIIGMSPLDGISLSNHNGFKQIMNNFNGRFECSYKFSGPPVHSKMYIWLANDIPRLSYLGSANYTQTAFNERRQKEVLTECNCTEAHLYFENLINDSVYCNHPDAENLIGIYNDNLYQRRARIQPENIEGVESEIFQPNFRTLESITVSLLDKDGDMHNVGGLNWGQRSKRERNQAYLQLSPDVYKSNFFPIKKTHFTVLTDDNITLICTRAQKNAVGTAIQTPHNNSLLGEYFRNRLGLANGAFVTKDDLVRYGRTEVTFYKIDDENYYMDFAVQ